MKKKFAVYGLQDSRIVPLFKCSWTKLWTSWISFWFRGKRHPGIVDGVPRSSSIVWSHIVCLGSRCDFSSLKTLLCLAYSCGIFVLSVSWAVSMVALQSKIRFAARRGVLIVRGMNRALAASVDLSMIGSYVWSIQPLFQSIFGCVAANQGYPKMALCSPSWVRKNLMLVVMAPVQIMRSV